MEIKIKTLKIVLLPVFLLLLSVVSIAEEDKPKPENRTMSPYFVVNTPGNEVNSGFFPLIETTADVNIVGVIADVTVRQVYTNNGEQPVEAQYVFPGSTRSAVYGMKMTIGDRVINAVVKEKKQAKEEYEKAKEEGKSASLLEQKRPNVFQMNVANIRPGDTIIVELKYTELLVPEEGIYEFVYPTVVGPRYTGKDGVEKDKWVESPYVGNGEKPENPPQHHFDIHVSLLSSVPIKDLSSVSHAVITDFRDASKAIISLQSTDTFQGDKDFILRFALKGEQIETGLSLFEGEEKNFFLLMMQPPKRIIRDEIPPREYIFIVDVSGSMRGFPLDISKTLMKNLFSNLNEYDKFNVLLFSASSAVLSETSLNATSENIEKAIKFIDKESGGGGTELLPALRHALSLHFDENYSRSVIIATDGYVTIETEAFDYIRNNLGKANFFSFGIGESVNRFLIEGMARAGHGEPFVITSEDEAAEIADRFRRYIQMPLLTNVNIDFGDFEVYDSEPKQFPDLFAEKPLIVFGKWKGNPKGTITLNGKNSTNSYSKTIDVTNYTSDSKNKALSYLWARHRVMVLSDYNNAKRRNDEKIIEEITQLGLKYNIMTEYTSFLAVDNQHETTVGDFKTPSSSTSVPEPHEWLLILTFVVIVGILAYKKVVS